MKSAIQEIIDRETLAWNTQNVDLLISVFHPDMVWPWPKDSSAHDPMDWIIVQGRFDRKRWASGWQELFDSHALIHNERVTKKVDLSREGDGAFAVVDINTLWKNHKTGEQMNWLGRTGKTYTKVSDEWKMIHQLGVLDYARAKPKVHGT